MPGMYEFGSYQGIIAYFAKKNRITHKGQRIPEGNPRGERRPASCPGRCGQRPDVSAGTAEETIALGRSWVAGAAPKLHAGSSVGDTAIELLSEVVTWSVLVWFARQRGVKTWTCDGPCNFRGAADGLLCARGRRTSRCGCSGGPVSREWWISPGNQSTTRLKFAWLTSVSGTGHVERVKLPKLKNTRAKRFLVEFVFYVLFESQVKRPAR